MTAPASSAAKSASLPIRQALALHQQGQLDAAERLYADILKHQHDHFDALHLLGVLMHQRGKSMEALKLITSAVAINAKSADAYANQGRVFAALQRPSEALTSYERALALKPDYAEVLFDRGNILHKLNRTEEAIKSLDRAILLKPHYSDALHNRGVILQGLGQFCDAIKDYDRVISISPNNAMAFNNRGVVLGELRQFEEALLVFNHALALKPDYAEAHFNRGRILKELNRLEDALASYDRALSACPKNADALYNRGNVFRELKQFEQALDSYDRLLELEPEKLEAINNRGTILGELKRYDEALSNFDHVLSARPDDTNALLNRGNIFHELKRYDNALVSYDRAITVCPEHADALYNRGNVLHELKRFNEALESYDRALCLRANFSNALHNRGTTLKELKHFDEALASYACALSLQPDEVEVHWSEALLRLLRGDYRRGWEKYEWRWKRESMALERRNFEQPLWLGNEDISDKTVLLHSEQGFGDTIQFCRYVPVIAARCAHVILEVPKPLVALMGSLDGRIQIVAKGNPLPDFDYHCPLLSLPLACGTVLKTIPARSPYLNPPPQSLQKWKTRLGPRRRPTIGLAWSGNETHKNDHNRSCGLGSFLPLLDLDATFVSVQKDVRSNDLAILNERHDICHYGQDLEDFCDTAALISHLDLVISVDTSIAHLAGALGKPVWVLLTYIPDWRWLLDRNDSPWYPTARLFRQDETRTWDKVILQIRNAASAFVRSERPYSR